MNKSKNVVAHCFNHFLKAPSGSLIYDNIGTGAISCKYANCITLVATCIQYVNIKYKKTTPNSNDRSQSNSIAYFPFSCTVKYGKVSANDKLRFSTSSTRFS